MSEPLELLISGERIQARVAELGRAIAQDFPPAPGAPPLWLAAALKGACLFQADLARAVGRDVSLGFVRAASYGAEAAPSAEVSLTLAFEDDVAGADVILVEDIVDTGRTASALLEHIASLRPRTLRLAALLDKPLCREVPVQIDYSGFEIPNQFVVGYGLDYAERYRNRPDISILKF